MYFFAAFGFKWHFYLEGENVFPRVVVTEEEMKQRQVLSATSAPSLLSAETPIAQTRRSSEGGCWVGTTPRLLTALVEGDFWRYFVEKGRTVKELLFTNLLRLNEKRLFWFSFIFEQ